MANLSGKISSGEMTCWDFYIKNNVNQSTWETQGLQIEGQKIPYYVFDEDQKKFILRKDHVLTNLNRIKLHDKEIHEIDRKKCARFYLNDKKKEYFIPINKIKKPSNKSQFKYQRQEHDLINWIKYFLEKMCPKNDENKNKKFVTLVDKDKNVIIPEIVDISKVVGKNKIGTEPIVDLVIKTTNGKTFNISCKNITSPSDFGGGLSSMLTYAKTYIKNVLDKVYKETQKHSDEFILDKSEAQDIYVEIKNKDFLKAALKGSVELGGEIDFYFIGEMKLNVQYINPFKENKMKICNGDFYTIDQYKKEFFTPSNKYYIRIRKRLKNHVYTDKKDENGIYKIFESPNGTSRARVNITKEKPVNCKLLINDDWC